MRYSETNFDPDADYKIMRIIMAIIHIMIVIVVMMMMMIMIMMIMFAKQ